MFRSRGVHESPTRIPESVEKRFRWLTGRRVLRRSEEEEESYSVGYGTRCISPRVA
jgi:hypothetical protein